MKKMKSQQIKFKWLTVMLLTMLLFSQSRQVFAADNGGSVQTSGVIEFYEDKPTETSSDNQKLPQTKPTVPQTTKKSFLPQTGENESSKLLLNVAGISILIGIFTFTKWRGLKGKEEGWK